MVIRWSFHQMVIRRPSARLAAVCKRVGHRVGRRSSEVGIGKDEHRVLAAELEDDALER